MSILTRTLKALVTKHSLKDRLKTAFTYLSRLKHVCEDVSPAKLFIALCFQIDRAR